MKKARVQTVLNDAICLKTKNERVCICISLCVPKTISRQSKLNNKAGYMLGKLGELSSWGRGQKASFHCINPYTFYCLNHVNVLPS